MFSLIQSSPLEIIFDPISTEERLPSVAFDITVNWIMPYQNVLISIKECWFEYSELNRFQDDLKRMSNNQLDKATLCDMSLKPIILLQRNNDKVVLEFIASDSVAMGTASFKTNLYQQEVTDMIQNIKDWSKWW